MLGVDQALVLFPRLGPRGFFSAIPTKARLAESCGGPIPPAIYPVRFSPTMIPRSISLSTQGGPASNQSLDGFSSTTALLGLPDVRTGGEVWLA